MPLNNQVTKTVFLFSALGLQLGIAMYVAAYFGEKLDAYTSNTKPWWTLLFMLFAMFGVIMVVLKRLKKK